MLPIVLPVMNERAGVSVMGFVDSPAVPGRFSVTKTEAVAVAPWLSVIVYENVSSPLAQPRGS